MKKKFSCRKLSGTQFIFQSLKENCIARLNQIGVFCKLLAIPAGVNPRYSEEGGSSSCSQIVTALVLFLLLLLLLLKNYRSVNCFSPG